MDITSLIIFLIIGALAGWIAGSIMKGKGYGIVGNMVIGIIGAVIGGLIFDLVGIAAGGFIGSLITATVGAIVLIYTVRLLKKA